MLAVDKEVLTSGVRDLTSDIRSYPNHDYISVELVSTQRGTSRQARRAVCARQTLEGY